MQQRREEAMSAGQQRKQERQEHFIDTVQHTLERQEQIAAHKEFANYIRKMRPTIKVCVSDCGQSLSSTTSFTLACIQIWLTLVNAITRWTALERYLAWDRARRAYIARVVHAAITLQRCFLYVVTSCQQCFSLSFSHSLTLLHLCSPAPCIACVVLFAFARLRLSLSEISGASSRPLVSIANGAQWSLSSTIYKDCRTRARSVV